MLKIKKLFICLLVVCILGTIALCIARYIDLNRQYPNPDIYIAEMGEELAVNDYTFKCQSLTWHDGGIIDSIIPGYILMYSDYDNKIAYPNEKIKVALAEIKITKNSSEEGYLDLTNIAFAMGAWGNQWNMNLFTALNAGEDVAPLMSQGESRVIVFPIVMYDFQFSASDWKKIENRELDIVLSYYPQKYILRVAATE